MIISIIQNTNTIGSSYTKIVVYIFLIALFSTFLVFLPMDCIFLLKIIIVYNFIFSVLALKGNF